MRVRAISGYGWVKSALKAARQLYVPVYNLSFVCSPLRPQAVGALRWPARLAPLGCCVLFRCMHPLMSAPAALLLLLDD